MLTTYITTIRPKYHSLSCTYTTVGMSLDWHVRTRKVAVKVHFVYRSSRPFKESYTLGVQNKNVYDIIILSIDLTVFLFN